jgi:hypothetical protein
MARGQGHQGTVVSYAQGQIVSFKGKTRFEETLYQIELAHMRLGFLGLQCLY